MEEFNKVPIDNHILRHKLKGLVLNIIHHINIIDQICADDGEQ